MSDPGTGGGAALSGLGAAAAAPPAATNATPPAGGAPPPATGTAPNGVPEWAATLPDELRQTVAAKGWKDQASAIASYRNLEQVLGADRAGRTLVVPTEDTPEAWAPIYDKLGRPPTPEGYELAKGGDPEFTSGMAKAFHEAGISGKQAKAMEAAFAAAAPAIVERQEAERLAVADRDLADLRKAGPTAFGAKVADMKRAQTMFGIEDAELDTLQKALGTKRALTFLADIGKRLGEDTLPSAATGGSQLGSAAVQIESLKGDREFRAKLASGDPASKRRWEDLHKLQEQQQR